MGIAPDALAPEATPRKAQGNTADKARNDRRERDVESMAAILLNRGAGGQERRAGSKKAGRSGGGLSGLLAKSSGEEGKTYYIDDGLFCPVVVGVEAGALPSTEFVIRRTSTRRLSARPLAVLFDSTGLSLPRPIT